MPERIYKLQPNRTIQLRGFNDLGASAAMHSATETGFKLSGIFRDPADFCVLTLFDADNFFEHPSLRYLPDMNFDGLTLSFDVHYSGLRNLDSPRYKILDWPYLDVIRENGTTDNIALFNPNNLVSGTWTPATARFTVVDGGIRQWDHLTLWFLGYAFDVVISDPVYTEYFFENKGAGFTHSITVNGVIHAYVEQAGDWDGAIAERILQSINLDPTAPVTATRTMNQLLLLPTGADGEAVTLSCTSSTDPLEERTVRRMSASSVAAEIARQCNATNWSVMKPDITITASANGPEITFTAAKPGVDGNCLSMYAVAKNPQLTTTEEWVQFTGGNSDATWRVSINFRDRGIPLVRKMWLTFAPPISVGKPFEDTEWEAVFTNWSVTGPEDLRRLDVAGPESQRIEPTDSACDFQGEWTDEHGFYSRAYAKVSNTNGNSVTIRYDASSTHELWLGTSLYIDRGSASLTLDGAPIDGFSARLDTKLDPAVITRRALAKDIPAGSHTLTIVPTTDAPFYFDYLDVVVRSGIPDSMPARTNISPALDYSTDHTYKLPPARILWMFDKLGFAGPMNEYIGVFWWNQRKRDKAVIPRATLTFTGEYKYGDAVWLSISGTAIGKSVFGTDNNATIARHFACYLNATFAGLWASASGNVLTITSHSPTADFQFDLSHWVIHAANSTGAVEMDGSLRAVDGEIKKGWWYVDTSQTPALNRGAREWHADFFRECKAHGRELVVAASMELVMPPDELPAKYQNGVAVQTSVGYGSDWWSSHCAFNSAMLAFQKQVFGCIAGLMAGAGLTPDLQFGEFCWWYFKSKVDGTMALYDQDTLDAAHSAFNRQLATFGSADDDPLVNSGADAQFLRNRLRDHVASLISHVRMSHPDARFEVLFPYDVNYPRPAGKSRLGGRLLRYINLPVEWETPQTAGFDRLKMEGLDWGALTRDLDLVREVMEFPIGLGWPLERIRYMMPIFNGGCPWQREYRIAKGLGIPAINMWAFDHVCIFGLPVEEPSVPARAYRF